MNKFTKRLLALGLALSISVGAGGVSVFAKTGSGPAQGFLNGHRIYCFSDIGPNSARAKTIVYYNGGMTRVSSDYTYINNKTLRQTTINKQNRGIQSTEVGVLAPGGCRSVMIRSKHTVEFSSKWTGTTYVRL